MEQTQQTPEPAPMNQPSEKQQSYGALISLVIVVAIIIVGAFYVWGERASTTEEGAGATTEEGASAEAPVPGESVPETEAAAQ